jgi:hypothetical protein
VYRNEKPFHPSRFWKFISKDFPQTIIRSKGLFWIASRPAQAINWSQAGGSMKAEGAGVWWASMPFGERIKFQNFADNQEIIEERWTTEFGDRLNELVLIGINLNEIEVRMQFEKCICTDEEIMLMQNGMFDMKDDFPIEKQFAENFHPWFGLKRDYAVCFYSKSLILKCPLWLVDLLVFRTVRFLTNCSFLLTRVFLRFLSLTGFLQRPAGFMKWRIS